MEGVSWARDRELIELQKELTTSASQLLLIKLHASEPFLRCFARWAEVVEYLRTGVSKDPCKDEILRAIFKAHAADQDPRWRTILLAIFWPGLRSIFFRKRHWDPDQTQQLWSTILWVFLEVVCRIDVTRRSKQLASKVINDVYHRLYDEYCRAWDRADHEKCFDREELRALADEEEIAAFAGKVHDCENSASLGLREEIEAEIRRLREHVEAGRISEADFLLLVGTKVYRQSISDYARETSRCYQTIRKRHQRAMATLRRVAGGDR